MKQDQYHHLRLRGGTWYFVAQMNKHRFQKALSDSETNAMQLRDQFLYEIKKYGKILSDLVVAEDEVEDVKSSEDLLFGDVAYIWNERKKAEKRKDQIKSSTLKDYQSSMNCYILPRFGSLPIRAITASDVDDFIFTLGDYSSGKNKKKSSKKAKKISPKRINNILVPMRSLFKMAKKKDYVSENIMLDVDNLKLEEPDIFPLDIEQVRQFLDVVTPHFQPFFIVAFFTGMRFGEMAALKWKNVDLKRNLILVRETRVYGEESRPKTKKSRRDVDMLPPVREALCGLKELDGVKDGYVFHDAQSRLLGTNHVRNLVWKVALEKAGIDYRPMLQTRHTFATMMIDAGEDLGWVQKMLGHSSLQMIYTRYYSWVKRETRNDGSAFLAKAYHPEFGNSDSSDLEDIVGGKVIDIRSMLRHGYVNVTSDEKRGYTVKRVTP